MTKANERPFSFWKRDLEKLEEKKKKIEEARNQVPVYNYKANPVPDTTYRKSADENLLEAQRKIRIKERAEKLYRSASLPPRMEMWKEVAKKTKTEPKTFSFRPNIKHDVPDFAKLQKQFMDELNQRKQKRKPTEYDFLPVFVFTV